MVLEKSKIYICTDTVITKHIIDDLISKGFQIKLDPLLLSSFIAACDIQLKLNSSSGVPCAKLSLSRKLYLNCKISQTCKASKFSERLHVFLSKSKLKEFSKKKQINFPTACDLNIFHCYETLRLKPQIYPIQDSWFHVIVKFFKETN